MCTIDGFYLSSNATVWASPFIYDQLPVVTNLSYFRCEVVTPFVLSLVIVCDVDVQCWEAYINNKPVQAFTNMHLP
jgi:hypothetical protein